MIIIGTLHKLEVGKRYDDGMIYRHGEFHDVPMLVVREATMEEHQEFAKSEGREPPEWYPQGSYFYAVLVD
jgi:hypothetical protein